MRQVVDTETAQEFMRETLEKVDADELEKICAEVEAKSAWFQKRLAPDAISELAPEHYENLLRCIFPVRRKLKQFQDLCDLDTMRGWMAELLHGEQEIQARFETFVARFESIPDDTGIDFASELLHFTHPDKYWLWTRWMWNPRTRTGSLPLVTSAAFDLEGETPGEVYVKVGQGLAFVHEVGEAAGFQTIRRNVFGTDVFLCCVYVIYAYTVLRMRMTQEFNKVMPGLPEFCRRLLGVYRKGPRPPAAPQE